MKIMNMRVGSTEGVETEQTLIKEAVQRFGLDADNYSINYIPAGHVKHGDETKDEFILFVVNHQTIEKHIELPEEAQLKPAAIDTIPGALLRSSERSLRRREDKEHTAVFVDIGSRVTTVVFDREGEISFVKQVPIGGERFNDEIASRLNISLGEAQMLRGMLQNSLGSPAPSSDDKKVSAGPQEQLDSDGTFIGTRHKLDVSTREMMVDAIGAAAEELAKEISMCSRYYTVTFRGKRIERAIVSGGEAYETILQNVLRRQLAVQIEVTQPLRGLDTAGTNLANDKRGLFCEWAVAVGLSIKGMD